MKYIDAEKLKNEIEKLLARANRRTDKEHLSHNSEMEKFGEDYWNGYGDFAYGLLGYIDSLQQEQPSEDLEEAEDKYIRRVADASREWTTQNIADAFKAGAEWQEKQDLRWADEIHKNGYNLCKEQMLKDAVEGEVCKGHIVTEKPFYFYQSRLIELPDNLKEGDKVKIVIVKEDYYDNQRKS